MNDWSQDVVNTVHPTELYSTRHESLDVTFAHGTLKEINLRENNAVACRVISGDHLGFCAGTVMTPFVDLYRAALETAEFGRKVNFSFLDAPANTGPEVWDHINPEIEQINRAAMIDLGHRILDRLHKAKPGYNTMLSLAKDTEQVRILTSHGLDRCYSYNSFGIGIGLDRTIEGDLLNVHDVFHTIPTDDELETRISNIIETLTLAERVVPMDGGKHPVLITPKAFTYLWEPLYNGLNARNVFEKVSPIRQKLGERILSEKITLLDDPTWTEGANHTFFDDEGLIVQKRALVEKGILKSFINNLDYAARLNVEPTGNGYRRSWLTNARELGGGPDILPSNRIVLPGTDHYQDMIASIDCGILLVFTADCWLGNLMNGDFSGTIDFGFKIEKGKPVGRIKNMRLSGNVYTIFNDQLAGVSIERERSYNGHDLFPSVLCHDVNIS